MGGLDAEGRPQIQWIYVFEEVLPVDHFPQHRKHSYAAVFGGWAGGSEEECKQKENGSPRDQ